MKTVFKKGQTVYWGEIKGEVIDITFGSIPIKVKFKNGAYYYFTLTGSPGEDLPPVLSLTPYTLNGFSQEPQIEKDTLVYVRDSQEEKWEMMYYSGKYMDKYYCYVDQKKSTETKEEDFWLYMETENPLLK